MNKKAIFCLAGLSCVISTALLAEETGAEKVPENAEVITQEAVTEPTTEPSGVITQETVTQPATEPSELVTQETVTEPAKAVATSGVSTGILAGLAALAAAAAGSSSSSSSSTSTAASGTLYYTEYTAQYGLASINALSLNDSGYTGSGVKLAIVDTGINSSHSEFSGRTISGYDFSTGTGGYSSDVHGHGTHVASIAAGNRDAIGMRGVAYDATLYSYKLLDDSGSVTMTDALYASLFNRHVTDSIKVSNNSWGSSSAITTTSAAYLSSTYPLGIAAMQAAVSAGTIFVWAAGNSGLTQPSIQAGLPYYVSGLLGQWLAVVDVNASNTETSYTNRCGVAATWCVTAPGYSIYAAQSSGTYVTYSGTSMAAPHVSGVLATLIQAFPSLTPAQIVTRLTSTASLSGLTSYTGCTLATCGTATMSAIFGYGLINSTAAISRIGSSWVLPSGKNYYSDGTYVANASSAVLPAGLPSSATEAIKNRDFVVFDSFDGANFTIKGSELFGQNTSVKQSNLRYAPSPTGSATARSSKADFASVNTLPGTDLKFGFAESQQGSIAGNLSFWGDKAFMMPTMDSGNPMQRNYAGEFSLSFAEKSAVNYFYELSQDGKLNAHGFGFTQTVFKKLELNFSAGIANDQSYALGYRSDAVVSNVYSTPMKIGARYPVSNSWEVYGYASSRGVSDLDATNRSWGLSQGTYSAYSVGAEWKREGGDRFVAGVYQPESLSNGALSLVVPAGRKTDGTILWKKEMFDVNEQVDPGLFLAGKMPLNWGSQNKPELRFQMQTNPQNSHSVDKASIDIAWAF